MATALPDVPQLTDLETLVSNILGIAARLIGLAVFIMLLVGGFTIITAFGDPKKVEQGQKTLTAAVFGLVFIIAAWFFLLILEQLTGADLTTFQLLF